MNLKLLSPLSDRNFRLLWAGQSISYVGNGVALVALAWQTLALSPHATSLSLVLFARTVPLLLLLLLGGAVTDRGSRRAILIASDAIRALVVALIAALAATGSIRLWHVVALAAVFGSAEAFFFPAFTAIVPQMLDGDRLVHANALESAIRPLTARMIGPALGGLVIAGAGTDVAFGIDAATFAFSTACLIAMRVGHVARTDGERPSLTTDIVEGFRYTRSQPWIWATLVMAAFAVLCFVGPQDVVIPIYAREHLKAGARGYGFLIGVMGAGGILGALVASQTGIGRRRVRNMYLVWGIAVVPFALMALTNRLAVAMILMGLIGFGFEVGTIMWVTLLQDLVPGRLMGRVRSLDYLISFALMPLSYAIAGPVANAIGILPTIALGGALASVVTFAFMLYPGVFDPDRDDYVPNPGSKAAEALTR